MATFAYTPEFGAQEAEKARILRAQFGDGYSQTLLDGINATPREWSLTFANRVQSEADAIVAFFVANAGTVFDWTPPTGAVGKWECIEWTRTMPVFGYFTVQARFSERFDP